MYKKMKPKFILIDGENTSGKTTLQNLVYGELKKSHSCILVPEWKMLDTFLSKDITVSQGKLKLLKIFQEHINKKSDYVIFDRSHFSNINYLNTDFSKFKVVDKFLEKNNAKLILLTFKKKLIVRRIRETLKNRKEKGFINYIEEITSGCSNTQEENKVIYQIFSKGLDKNKDSLSKTRLRYVKIDVSNLRDSDSYKKLLPKIIKFIEN